jgi:hypothetical protein
MKDKHDYKLISEAYASIYKENDEQLDGVDEDIIENIVPLYCVIHDESCKSVEDCEVKQGTVDDLLYYIFSDGKNGAFGDPSNQGENDHWNYIWDYNDKKRFENTERICEDAIAGKSIRMGHYTGFMVFNRNLDKAKADVDSFLNAGE